MHKLFWILTATVFTALLLPALVQEGMFLDGVSYASIARNMAMGLGDLAHPYYTAGLYPVCYEQPPLALWIQSLFFSVLGDHFWVERFYSLILAMASAWAIVLNWKLLRAQSIELPSDKKNISWLPMLLWIVAPIVFWGYQNNMLECTMSFFVLISAFFAARSEIEKRPALLLPAALFTVAAVLSKGPVGFFPVAVPIAWSIAYDRNGIFGASVRTLVLLALTLALLGLFIFMVPGMSEYLDYYLNKQLLPTLSGVREKQVENPFSFLSDLISQVALPVILIAGLWVKRGFQSVHWPKSALFFLIVGLAGTLPLVFTPKQSAHYLIPSIPFYALGFAAMLSHNLRWNPAFLNQYRGWLEKIAWLVLGTTLLISISFWGKSLRDESKIRDTKVLCKQVGKHTIIGIPQHFSNDWLLIAYLSRFGNVSLDSRAPHDFWLMEKGGTLPEGFEKLETEMAAYELCKRL